MTEPSWQIGLKIGLPGIVSVETDNIFKFFQRRRESRGPFLLIVRSAGLALDTAFGSEEHNPILWPPHAELHQLWYFRKTDYRDQFEIISVANGLALDAHRNNKASRPAVMRSRHGTNHQRWRLLSTADGAACLIESVSSGHVLDVPWEAGPETRTPPVLYSRHGGRNQQFIVAAPSHGIPS
jgi:hypothetical protein